MHTVSLGLLSCLLLFEVHKEVALLLVGGFQCLLFDRGPKEGGAAVVMYLHHFLLLLMYLRLLILIFTLLEKV